MTVIAQAGEFGIAIQYSKYRNGTVQPLLARARIDFVAQPNDADTLTIDSVAYRFKTTPAAANDIQIGTDILTTLTNLQAATAGLTLAGAYYAATKALLRVDVAVGTQSLFLSSYLLGQAGNSLALSQGGSGVATRFTLGSATLLGGVKGGAAQSARGRIVINALPTATDTLVVGSTTYTFAAGDDTGNNFDIPANNTPTLLAIDVAGKLASNAAITNVVLNGHTISFDNVSAGTAGNSTVLTVTVTVSGTVQVTGSGTLTGGLAAGVFPRGSLAWNKFRSREVNYGVNHIQQVLPLEVGGDIEPLGAYKSGVNIGGGATILPRLENEIGWLLLAALGQCTTTSLGSGVYQHVFKFSPNQSDVPWFAARKMIPGRSNGQYVQAEGLVGFDNIIAALRMTVPAGAPVELQTQIIGRVPELDNHPEGWISGAYEDGTTVPIACNGAFTIPTIFTEVLPVTQVILELANGTTGPREETIVGSYFMDDIVNRTRALSLRFMYKWASPELYQRLFGNASGAIAWSPQPFITNTSGGNYAFNVLLASAKMIGSTQTPYSLSVRSNSVFWEPQGDIVLQGGGIVMQEIMGTALVPNSGAYCEFVLINANSTGYPLPTEP